MEDRLPRKLAAILYADAGYSRLTGDALRDAGMPEKVAGESNRAP